MRGGSGGSGDTGAPTGTVVTIPTPIAADEWSGVVSEAQPIQAVAGEALLRILSYPKVAEALVSVGGRSLEDELAAVARALQLEEEEVMSQVRSSGRLSSGEASQRGTIKSGSGGGGTSRPHTPPPPSWHTPSPTGARGNSSGGSSGGKKHAHFVMEGLEADDAVKANGVIVEEIPRPDDDGEGENEEEEKEEEEEVVEEEGVVEVGNDILRAQFISGDLFAAGFNLLMKRSGLA